jgi:Mn2+/Fe2+ NRAMP family transporter
LLIVANAFNIGADLGGMGAVLQMISGVPAYIGTTLFALLLLVLIFRSSYRTIARVFKWLTLVLFSYIATAFLAKPDWPQVVRATFIPRIEWTPSYISVLVGILGTTISPYLFFWQAAQETEEEREHGKTTLAVRRHIFDEELRSARTDVVSGMLLSNVVMYFIILTTASTLHAHGIRNIETAEQASEALRPLAGNGARWLFMLGLIGTGILAIPVLAGSCAYAIAEAARWRGASLDRKPRRAQRFYAVIALAMLIGLVLNYAGLNAVKMLFWSAVANGVLAPPLVILVVLVTSDKKVMGERTNSRVAQILGWTCAIVMTAAAVALLIV